MEVDVGTEQVTDGIAVHVRVRLTPRELNALFLAGDTLILLPAEGIAEKPDAPISRTSMFLSEIAGNPQGFARVFADADHADRFSQSVKEQIANALEGS